MENIIKIKRIKRKSPKDATEQLYPSLITYSLIGAQQVIDRAIANSQVEGAIIPAVMLALQNELKNFVFNGHNVQVEGLGNFYLKYKTLEPQATAAKLEGSQVAARTIGFRRSRTVANMMNPANFSFQEYQRYEEN